MVLSGRPRNKGGGTTHQRRSVVEFKEENRFCSSIFPLSRPPLGPLSGSLFSAKCPFRSRQDSYSKRLLFINPLRGIGKWETHTNDLKISEFSSGAVSVFPNAAGIEHVVRQAQRVGARWRARYKDSFVLVDRGMGNRNTQGDQVGGESNGKHNFFCGWLFVRGFQSFDPRTTRRGSFSSLSLSNLSPKYCPK